MNKMRITPKEVKKINADLRRYGFDGNGRFETIGQGLSKLSEVLTSHQYQLASIFHSHYLQYDALSITLTYEKINEHDIFSPIAVTNSIISFSWYKTENNRYEITIYLSS